MKFLMVSDFPELPDSGAPGTIISVGNALEAAGHSVELVWKQNRRVPKWYESFDRYFVLPRLQSRLVGAMLSQQHYDVVIVSQPFAYKVYEEISPSFRNTLFLNRTHGWEERLQSVELKLERSSRLNKSASGKRAISRYLMSRCSRRTVNAADAVVTGCSKCREFILKRHRIAPSRVNAIPYGLDHEYLRAEAGNQDSDDKLTRLLFVGNLIQIKGSNLVVEIAKKCRDGDLDAEMSFVVSSSDVESLRKDFPEKTGSRVRITSWRSRSDLRQEYARSNTYLFASYFEGFGKAFLEAMAIGLCVVGQKEGGLIDVVKQQPGAIYFDPSLSGDLEKTLRRVIDEPMMRSSIARQGQVLARKYSWDRNAHDLVSFCRTLIGAELSSDRS